MALLEVKGSSGRRGAVLFFSWDFLYPTELHDSMDFKEPTCMFGNLNQQELHFIRITVLCLASFLFNI